MALRCLIVDDNAGFLHAARDLLERQGISVVGVASTSLEALRRVDELRPDVALVDVVLGEENGFDVACRLVARGDGVHVILISTYAEHDLDELIGASRAIGFLSKSALSRQAIDALLGGAGGPVSERPGR